MTNPRSMKIAALLILAFIVGCHSNSAANNARANDQAQANNVSGTATAADANSGAMGAPGTQPVQQQGNGAQSAGANRSTGQMSVATPTAVTANPSATSLPTRPPAGTNGGATLQPISVPSGTVLKIRLNETLNVKHTQTGQSFTGSVVDAVAVNGATAIDRGAGVSGVVDRSHRRGRFKGASILELRLTSLDQNGQHYRIDTRDVVRTKKGKGKRTAGLIGGGAGLGMLIGGVATGGVGLLVGGLAGGGAGTLGAAFTGNRDITIPAESVLSFRLADPIEIHP